MHHLVAVAAVAVAMASANAKEDAGERRLQQEERLKVRLQQRALGQQQQQQQLDSGGQTLLALPGPAFPNFALFVPPRNRGDEGSAAVASGAPFFIHGRPIQLTQATLAADCTSHEVLTAGSLWDCSLVLAKYFERATQPDGPKLPGEAGSADAAQVDNSPHRVLEVGAGAGLVGIAYALCYPRDTVVLTDMPAVLPSLRESIARHGLEPRVAAAALDWFQAERDLAALGGPFDTVVAADVVWVEDLIPPLVATLERATRPGSLVYLCHQSRSVRGDRLLFDLLERHFARYGSLAAWQLGPPALDACVVCRTEVPRSHLHPDFNPPGKIHLYRFTRL
jgi:hypothetical protein